MGDRDFAREGLVTGVDESSLRKVMNGTGSWEAVTAV